MTKSNLFESFKYTRILLKLTGIWPKADAKMVYKVTGITSFLLSAIFSTLASIQTYFDFTGIESVSYSVFLSLVVAFYLIKVLVFYSRRHSFYDVLKYLKQPVLQSYEDELDFYIKTNTEIFTKLQLGFQVLCFVTLLLVGLIPFYGHDFKRELPVPFPFDLKEQPIVVYGFLWILQIYIMNLSALNNSSLDLLACCFMGIVSAQLQILREKLKNVTDKVPSSLFKEKYCSLGEIYTKEILLGIKDCVEHHNAIELLVDSIDSTFTFMFLVQFASSVCIICITLFTFVLVPLASVQFGVSLLFCGCVTTQLAIYCAFGNDVIVQSSTIGEGCYTSDWYNCDIAVKKSFFIIMERSKRPYVLTAGKFITLSISSFIMIVKSSFSYFAVLQKLYDKSHVEQR